MTFRVNLIKLNPRFCLSAAPKDGRMSAEEPALIPRPTREVDVLQKEDCGS